MILAIIILTALLVAALIFALFCFLHYQLLRRDIEVNQKCALTNSQLHFEYVKQICSEISQIGDAILKLVDIQKKQN